jgi:hypothetical protein
MGGRREVSSEERKILGQNSGEKKKKNSGQGGCAFGSSRNGFNGLILVHWWLLVHSSPKEQLCNEEE